jgi:hypothetical protein
MRALSAVSSGGSHVKRDARRRCCRPLRLPCENLATRWFGQNSVRDGVIGLALLCGLLALDMPLLDLPHFWDSMTFVAGAEFLLANGFSPVLPRAEDYGHPVLLQEILALAWRVFGESVHVSHLVMVGFAFVTVYWTYLIGKSLYSWRTGLMAAVLLLFYPLFRAQSSLVLLDVPTAAFSVLAINGLVRGRTLWFVLSASAMVLTKATGVVLVPAALAYVFITRHKYSSPVSLAVMLGLHSVPLFVVGAWFWFHVHLTGWVSVPDNLGWLAVPEGISPGTLLLDYVPRMLFGRDGVVAGIARTAVADFGVRFMIGILTLFIVAHSLSIRSVRQLLDRSRPRAFLRQALSLNSISRAWGGAANLVIFGVPILLQLGLMAITTSLHRYLVPEYPMFFVAGAYAMRRVLRDERLIAGVSMVTLAIFTIGWSTPWLGSSLTSPSNGAFVDFVDLDRQASAFIEAHYADRVVLAGWPQYVELAMPALGYVEQPVRVVAPVGIQARQQARVQALNGGWFADPATIQSQDFDLLYYSARANPPDAELLRSLVQRFDLMRIAEFSRNADYVAIYAANEVASAYDTSRTDASFRYENGS